MTRRVADIRIKRVSASKGAITSSRSAKKRRAVRWRSQMSASAKTAALPKVRIATTSLAGCFGCHTSFLDIDERIFELAKIAEFDRSPFTDIKHCGPCDIVAPNRGSASPALPRPWPSGSRRSRTFGCAISAHGTTRTARAASGHRAARARRRLRTRGRDRDEACETRSDARVVGCDRRGDRAHRRAAVACDRRALSPSRDEPAAAPRTKRCGRCWCSPILGSISALRWALSRASVPSSSAAISRE